MFAASSQPAFGPTLVSFIFRVIEPNYNQPLTLEQVQGVFYVIYRTLQRDLGENFTEASEGTTDTISGMLQWLNDNEGLIREHVLKEGRRLILKSLQNKWFYIIWGDNRNPGIRIRGRSVRTSEQQVRRLMRQ